MRIERVWHWLENLCETIVSCQNELQNTALIDGVCQVVQTRHDGDAEGDDGADGDDSEEDSEHIPAPDQLRAVLLSAILQAAHLLVSPGVPLLCHAGLEPPSRDISQH